MAMCWELRGCDEEMQSRCPHNIPGEPCPAECHFAVCERPTHKVIDDPLLMLDPDINFDAAIKEGCRICSFFIEHAPDSSTICNNARRQGNPNRFLL